MFTYDSAVDHYFCSPEYRKINDPFELIDAYVTANADRSIRVGGTEINHDFGPGTERHIKLNEF